MKIYEMPDEARWSEGRWNLFSFLFLSLIVLAAYSNSFHCSWHLDDVLNILENRRSQMTEFSWNEIREALSASPSRSKVSFVRPISRLSLAMNYYFGGTEVFGYHVVNVSIHLIASLFLYLFIANALNLPFLKGRYGSRSHWISLPATALWAVHPIQTQAVTYIVQRMASMAGMFYIMALYFYVKAQRAEKKRGRLWFFTASLIAGLLSLGSKENAILIPVGIFLLHLLFVQGFTKKNLKKDLRVLSLSYLLPIALLTGILLIQSDLVERVLALYEGRAFTMWERLLTESGVVLFYITLLLYPLSSRFSIDHPVAISTSLLDPPSTLLSVLAIGALLILAVLLARKQPLVSFAILFFFLNHTAESTILPMELVFEHRNYIPSMFLFVPIAAGFLKLLAMFSQRRGMKIFLVTSACLAIATVGSAAYMRNSVWKDEMTLWTDCLSKYPSSFRAHNNLGRFFTLQGNAKRAAEEFRLALASPGGNSLGGKGITYFNLGLLAHRNGDLEQARSLYQKAIELDRCCPGAHNNLAGILLAGSLDHAVEALTLLDNAIECNNDPEIPIALGNKGILLWRLGRAGDALAAARRSIEIAPDNPMNLSRLGYMLKETGAFSEASLHFHRVLEIERQDIAAFFFTAEIEVSSSNIESARRTLKRLLRSVPREGIVRYLDSLPEQAEGIEIIPNTALLRPLLVELGLKD